MSKLRVCYDYQVFSWQRVGGISRYFTELAARIQALPSAQACVVAPLHINSYLATRRREIPTAGLYLGRAPRAPLLAGRACKALARALTALKRPDIVHETYYEAAATAGPAAKVVLTAYDMVDELFPELFPLNARVRGLRERAFQRADHVICISESTRRDLLRLYPVEPAKVSVAHLASSLERGSGEPTSLGDPYFLYVGQRDSYKNFMGLLNAFAQSGLAQSHQLLCFGGGGFKPYELEQAERLGLPLGRLRYLAGGDSLLARCYAGAEAFVYPSLYEGFGIPLLEAMACGCPILCGSAGSLAEVAGEAALYRDVADPASLAEGLLALARSAELRQALVAKGHARAKAFSWDKCAEQTMGIYQKLLGRA
jgi:glycosyltransferase involved in cell wall biosynthesis